MDEFAGKCKALTQLIDSWKLIPANTKNELYPLAQKLVNALQEGQTETRIKRILESELCITYGLFKTAFDADKLAGDVLNWWTD